MAEVLPVRGLLYDHARAGRFDDLVAPPYDVISESDRAALEAKSPFNIVRVDLPQGNREEKYRNAARELRRWIEEGILRRDRAPAFYRYQQIFSLAGREHTRKGFIGRIRLRRFEERRSQARSSRSSSEYASLFLTAMEDPGLVILPTHRVVHGLPQFQLSRFLERLRQRFAVEKMNAASFGDLRTALAQRERSFLLASGGEVMLLSLLPGAEQAVAGPEPLRGLDVPILHALILEEILGIDRAAQERQTNLRYLKDFDAAL